MLQLGQLPLFFFALMAPLAAGAVADLSECDKIHRGLNPALNQKKLMGALAHSFDEYEQLVDRTTEFKADQYFFEQHPIPHAPPAWTAALERYLERFIATRAKVGTIAASLKYLRPIRNYLSALPKSARETYADALTEVLADAAGQGEFEGVFKSTLYKFCEQYIYPIFWIPYQPATVWTYIRKPYLLDPFILGTEPIDGDVSTRTPYGFYSRHLAPIEIPKDAKVGDQILLGQVTQWTHHGHRYSNDLSVSVSAESIDPATPALKRFALGPYQKDGVLNGTIIIGANLASEDQSTIDGYTQFFKKMGYEFERTERTRDLKTYFKDQIVTGQMDYFIKEAHSDGDAENIFRITLKDKILVASRKMEDGRLQTVHLVIPVGRPSRIYDDPTRTALITKEEFAQWIQTRTAAGHPPLIDFNTSCWSVSKMVNEIEATHSSGLAEIASLTPVDLFEADQRNAEFIILSDFLSGRRFSTMRRHLRMNPDYARKIGNNFIFPDDANYQLYVREVIKPVLKISIRLTRDGKPYSIDE